MQESMVNLHANLTRQHLSHHDILDAHMSFFDRWSSALWSKMNDALDSFEQMRSDSMKQTESLVQDFVNSIATMQSAIERSMLSKSEEMLSGQAKVMDSTIETSIAGALSHFDISVETATSAIKQSLDDMLLHSQDQFSSVANHLDALQRNQEAQIHQHFMRFVDEMIHFSNQMKQPLQVCPHLSNIKTHS